MPASSSRADFVVVEPYRTSCDYFARALDREGKLRFLAIGTRRGTAGVRPESTRLYPAIGLAGFAAAQVLSDFQWESFRFRLNPWFDRWVRKQLQPGDHVISSYGYANACFAWARQHGGKTFLDGGNSHPENFWEILSEELRRWKSPYTPVARFHYERSLAMMEQVDYLLAPSAFVAKSFLARGFPETRILRNTFPLDLRCFSPPTQPRPKDRPLTIISTGRLSLRKGTPYLLEAFGMIHRTHPSARLWLTRTVESNAEPIVARHRHLPIDWAPPLPHPQLAERLRGADIFVLPSLEDGFAVTVAEALACGLPVITTPNTGASELISPGHNGEIVPIRDTRAIADALLKWSERVIGGETYSERQFDRDLVSTERFERTFLKQLGDLGLAPNPPTPA